MENATFLVSLAPASAVFCFPSEPNIPEGPGYEKISTLHVYHARGEVLPTPHRNIDSCCDLKITLENGSFRNRENLQYVLENSRLGFIESVHRYSAFRQNPRLMTNP